MIQNLRGQPHVNNLVHTATGVYRIARDSVKLDPWGTTDIADYSRLFKEFGIEPIDELVNRLPEKHRYFRRKIIFGHRDFQRIVEAIEKKEPYAVMSGLKPSNVYHFGNKMTADEIVFLQKLGGEAFVCIADLEAYADNGIPLHESEKIAIDNVADMLALGLDPKRAYIYRQSREQRVMNLAFIFSRGVTKATLEAIYGERPIGLYMSALVQAGDILLPQLEDFDGPKPVVVPVGADQDPHIRLTRDLARKFSKDYGFIPPSATYHKIIRSLTGSKKMSKREPWGMLTTNDTPDEAAAKFMDAFTGGRETAKLQKELGGEPEKCVVYEYYVYHLVEDDDKLREIYSKCISGEMLCGECKAMGVEYLTKFLEDHQRKKRALWDKAIEIVTSSPRR